MGTRANHWIGALRPGAAAALCATFLHACGGGEGPPRVPVPSNPGPLAPPPAPPLLRPVEPTPPPEPLTFAPLAPAPAPPRTDDGIPILTARPSAAARDGSVTWVTSRAEALAFPTWEATDGGRVYLGVRASHGVDGSGTSILVRDGVVYEDVLARLSGERGAGCGAAAAGDVLFAVPGRSSTRVWRVGQDGSVRTQDAPSGGGECRAWLDGDGRYTLALRDLVTWTGRSFEQADRSLYPGRITLGSPVGPRFCFSSCNGPEEAQTPPETRDLRAAIGCGDAGWVATADAIAGFCNRTHRAVRMRLPRGSVETLADIPPSNASYSHLVAMTAAGDVVIGLDYHFRRYAVWRAGSRALGPVRMLDGADVLARSSPTLLVRGLRPAVPEAEVSAVLLGRPTGFGSNGSTVAYEDLRRSPEAHAAQVARARAVLGTATGRALRVAQDTVVDPSCGTYVRSPIGWEQMHVSDWNPPALPPLDPRAVTRSTPCAPLATVAALPGDPDLLLGRTTTGELAMAWLPPPLPLPSGTSRDRPIEAPLPHVVPVAGSGFVALAPVRTVHGLDATAEPGADTNVSRGSWAVGGGGIVEVDDRQILVLPSGAMTLPPGTRPMAASPGEHRAWGAVGSRLVVCEHGCRVLDPGPPGEIVAVVPRTREAVILGYADGRLGVYEIPATGGDPVPDHALVARIEAFLTRRPRSTP